MKDRRSFLQQLTSLGLGISLGKINIGDYFEAMDNKQLSWEQVRTHFPITDSPFIHLNNGSAGVMPRPVQNSVFDCIKMMNTMPPYKAWDQWESVRTTNKETLAQQLGVNASELAIVRNTTEGLSNILFGLPLQKKDEIIAAAHDYPYALNCIQQREAREGIQLKKLNINLPFIHEDAIVAQYKQAITSKTKAILITYMTHREGHIMPVKKITEMAHAAGVEVILDAAHAFGQFVHKISDLGCDYYSTSLHKWLNAPHGTGLLYIKKDKIQKIFPLLSSDVKVHDKMVKFEYQGTRAFHQELGIGVALVFQEMIGRERKEARLHELKNYWIDQLKSLNNFKLSTDPQAGKSCAVASFSVGEYPMTNDLKKVLYEKHHIYTKTTHNHHGLIMRISPSIFTSEADLDVFVDAVLEFAG